MLKQIEGSQAIAQSVAACSPEVISAYPISPQTHIVEALSALVKAGKMGSAEYINVESEFAAMSACIGASAVGARTYTEMCIRDRVCSYRGLPDDFFTLNLAYQVKLIGVRRGNQ